MKKIITIILILCLTITVFSCQSIPDEQPSESLSDTYQSETSQPIGETPSTSIEEYETYNKLLASLDLPDTFVHYDEISHVGSFNNFIFLTDVRNGNYSQYMYILTDASGSEIYVSIYDDKPRDASSMTFITDVSATDLRTVSNTGSCYYTKNGIDYLYVTGELISISWYEDGLKYVVSASNHFGNYPISADTFVSKLLSADTAQNAVTSVSPEYDK